MSAPPLPTIYNTQTASYNSVQDGYFDVDTGVWSDAVAGMILGQNLIPTGRASIGLQFQLWTLDATSGLPLNPPIFPEPRPADVVTGAAAESSPFTLNLSVSPLVGAESGSVLVYIVPQANPAPYSTTIPPFSRGEFVFGPTAAYYYLGNFIYTGLDETRQSVSLDFAVMKPYIQHPNFRGTISLSILWAASTGRTVWQGSEGLFGQPTALALRPEIVARQTPFHTGMMVGEGDLKRRARAVHSYKSGFPYLSDEATPDGYTDGIMMHSDDYDPEDPVEQGHGAYVPPAGEGVIDDEITDLEG